MTLSSLRSRRGLVRLLVGVCCSLGLVGAVATPAFASAGYNLRAPDGQAWGTVSRINSHRVSANTNIWRDGTPNVTFKICYGYTEFGAFYQSGCGSTYGGTPNRTVTRNGLIYDTPWAAIGWVEVIVYQNGSQVNQTMLWP
jgi:hypothetical protein